MFYFHGSDLKIESFDKVHSSGFTYITPNKDEAKYHALKRTGSGYVYTIIVDGDTPEKDNNKMGMAITFRSTERLKIINCEKVVY